MKSEQIHLRVSKQDVKKYKEAAAFYGLNNNSAFIRFAANELYKESVEQRNQELTLTNRDRDAFLEALSNPPKPGKALKGALAEYRRYQGRNAKI